MIRFLDDPETIKVCCTYCGTDRELYFHDDVGFFCKDCALDSRNKIDQPDTLTEILTMRNS